MCRTEDGIVQYAPLCIHTFRLIAPRKLLEAQQFNQQYHSYEEIQNVPDRLRWCRHHMGLMQKEVAEQIGISRGHYIDYEVGYVVTTRKKWWTGWQTSIISRLKTFWMNTIFSYIKVRGKC